MRKISSENKNSNMYKFYLLNLGMAPSFNEVSRALDNLTIDDLSPCRAMNNTSNKTNDTLPNGTICTDAAGKFHAHTTNSVTNAPFIVKTCDQVLFISGAERLKDYDDCSAREPAFFTMSMYMVNYFKKNVSSTLQQSIYIESMTKMPSFVPGTKKQCLNFFDSRTPGGFAICFKDSAVTATLYASFMNFMKCRMGDNLRPLTLPQLKKVYELSCGGKPVDPKVLFSHSKNDLIDQIKSNFKKKGMNPWYGLDPPGSNIIEENEKRKKKRAQNLMSLKQ